MHLLYIALSTAYVGNLIFFLNKTRFYISKIGHIVSLQLNVYKNKELLHIFAIRQNDTPDLL